MNYTKIFGWVLLAAGLAIIGWSLFSAFNVFTGKSSAPEIFSVPEKAQADKETKDSQNIQAQMENMIAEQLGSMLSPETLSHLLNLTVYSMLIFIFLAGGGQIAGIGIKTLKT